MVAGVAIGAFGVLATRLGTSALDTLPPVLTLLTGWLVAVVGTATTRAATWSRTGPLLLAAAAAWFVPVLAAARRDWSAAGGTSGLLWAAILSHAVVTLPDGHVRSRSAGLLVVVGYSSMVAPADLAPLLVAGVLLATIALAGSDRGRRSDVPFSIVAGGALPVALVLIAGRATVLLPDAPFVDLRPALQLAFMASAGVIAGWTVGRSAARSRVTDLVVELGEADPGSLRGGLSRALRDPTLRVGIWLEREARFVDDEGRPFAATQPRPGRATTSVDRDGRQVALLEHRADLATDPALLAAIARAAGLATANAALLAELRDRAEQIRGSRARLVGAADGARLELRRRLREILDPRIEAQADALGRTPIGPREDTNAIARHLTEARQELLTLADGVHPATADGADLVSALQALAQRCPVPVTVTAPPALRLDAAVQRHVLFIAGEALANIAKHARAQGVEVVVESGGAAVRLVVRDDGLGGADPASGTGLLGLRDRAAAIGGSLHVQSPRGRGTVLIAELPTRGGIGA